VTDPASHDRTLAIFGVGLLGGSVAKAAKEKRLVSRVIGIGRNATRLQQAKDEGILDDFATDLAKCDPAWDLVVVATPVDVIPDDVRKLAEVSKPGTIITDVGSVKRSICLPFDGGLPNGVHFVGSHPLAGSEKTGFEASKSDLFEDKVTIVTPTDNTPTEALEAVKTFWEDLGSIVHTKSCDEHDQILALTSHLPHVVASALAALLPGDLQEFTATGFRDTTRIAAGDPNIWIPILMSNSEAILRVLGDYHQQLDEFMRAIKNQDAPSLKSLLEVAKTSREALDLSDDT
jgi:prephenate dehydrogenase